MWVEMSEGMCDHANNYYMLKKKGNQKEKYYHKLKTNNKKKKVCVCVEEQSQAPGNQKDRKCLFIYGSMYLKKNEMLPSEDDSLDINYNRSCGVIKERIPLRIIKN